MSDKKRRELTDVMHAKESPEARLARKQAEYEEEGDTYAPPPKSAPVEQETLLARIARLGRKGAAAMGAAVASPYSSLLEKDDEK